MGKGYLQDYEIIDDVFHVKENIDSTASIIEDEHCKDCGWPVVHACCNDEFNNFKDADTWDWWMYCTNKGCKNHEGEGVFQDWPEWVIKSTSN